MNIKRLWRQYQGFILSIALLLFCAVGALVGVLPIASSSLDMYRAIQKLETRTKTLGDKQRFLDSLDERTTRESLNILLSAVPRDKSLPTIFSTTDGALSTSGLSLVDMTITSPGSLATEAATRKTAEEKDIGVLLQPFTVTVSGTIDNFGNFLRNVTAVRRLLRVRSFSAVMTKTGTAQIHLNLDAFYNPLPKALLTVDQPMSKETSEDSAIVAKVTSFSSPGQSLPTTPNASTGRVNPFPQ